MQFYNKFWAILNYFERSSCSIFVFHISCLFSINLLLSPSILFFLVLSCYILVFQVLSRSISGYLSKSLSIFGNLRQFRAITGNLRQFQVISDYQGLFLSSINYQVVLLKISGWGQICLWEGGGTQNLCDRETGLDWGAGFQIRTFLAQFSTFFLGEFLCPILGI